MRIWKPGCSKDGRCEGRTHVLDSGDGTPGRHVPPFHMVRARMGHPGVARTREGEELGGLVNGLVKLCGVNCNGTVVKMSWFCKEHRAWEGVESSDGEAESRQKEEPWHTKHTRRQRSITSTRPRPITKQRSIMPRATMRPLRSIRRKRTITRPRLTSTRPMRTRRAARKSNPSE